MFGCAAQKLVHPMGLDSAHHNHIHLMRVGELAQDRDGVSLNEMSTIRGHTEPTGQLEE
ncbi:hypothetical protein D3C85_1860270 [compost metagenome]